MFEFSFIIPIYNAEHVLTRCLNSIEGQSIDSYEVIMIDDGSTDNSLLICNEYIKRHSDWHIFTQENSGPSKARNRGLDYAKGTYICFLDSDDYLNEDYLPQLHKKITENHPDVIFFGYQKEYSDKGPEVFIPNKDFTDKTDLCNWLSRNDLYGYTWVKCFSRKAIGKHRFNESMRLFEDEVFTCNVMEDCNSYSVIPKAIHHYVIGNSDALTMRTHGNYCQLLDEVYSAWKKLFPKSSDKDILQKKANAFTSICRYYGLERKVDVRFFFSSLKKTSFFNDHSNIASLDSYINKEQYSAIYFIKILYSLKQKAYKLFHKI